MSTTFENHTTIFQTGGVRDVTLGRIEPVSLHTVWRDDPTSFNQWLGNPANLGLLSQALELELEIVPKEGVRSNVFCRVIGRDHEVLISTQLDKTDNVHLGELLTYASSINAFSVIWICRRITEEHRSCLDWLNRITGPDVSFYAVELELWRIEDSKPAPRFNVVVRPNEWARSKDLVNQESAALQLRYWTDFYEYLFDQGGPLRPTKPYGQAWMSLHPFNRSSFYLNAFISPREGCIGVALEISGEDAAAYLEALAEHRVTIEAEIGAVAWKKGSARECRVVAALEDADPANELDWPRQHVWLASVLAKFHRIFGRLLEDMA